MFLTYWWDFLPIVVAGFTMRPHAVSELRTILERPLAAPVDEGVGGSGYNTIFPGPRGDARSRQLEETWALLLSQLRDPVDATLRGGMSAGDIAYRLGELVHNYFRTRGVTLTSFELRRIVVALLDNYRRGWPELITAPADMAAVFAGTPSATRSAGTLVAFVDRDGSRPRPPAGSWNGETAAAPPPVVTPDLPSSLVSVAPRGETRPAATPPADADADISIPPPPVPESQAPSPAALGVDAVLAAIMPVLQQQRGTAPAMSASRPEVVHWMRGAIDAAMASAAVVVAEAEREHLERLAFDELFGFGPLEPAIRDETVSAIFVNGPRAVFVDRRGRLEPARVSFRDSRQLEDIAERLAGRSGAAPMSGRDPLLDRRLDDGTRVTVVAPPLAPAGPYLVIRRPTTRAVTLESLVAEGALSPQMASVLRLVVRSRLNLLVCGGPGVGKTALLAALARAAPGEDRIVSIEDSPELRPDVPHHVPLIAADGSNGAAARAFTAALALRPDRLLIDGVTETLIPAIARAAAGGTDGVAACVLAATPQDGLDRLEASLRAADALLTLAEARRRLVHSFDLVVHLDRQGDGARRVSRLSDLVLDGDVITCRDLFAFDPASGRFAATGLRPNFLPRMARAGLESALLNVL
jgi:pilus assembly protein CpaF